MSVRPLSSVNDLPNDYEFVILPDGTQILRERQTKAQARIQALKVKSRNEKLRKTLILLSNDVDTSAEFTKPDEVKRLNQTTLNHQLKEKQNILPTNDNPSPASSIVDNLNETSAIQKQMISNSEINTDRHKVSNTVKKYQAKSAKFNALNL